MGRSNRLGRMIRMVRGGLTQQQFAKSINVSQGSVAKYEKGESIPGAATLLRIAGLGGVTVEELLGGGEEAGRSFVLSEEERRLVAAARELEKSDPALRSLILELALALARRGNRDKGRST
ncbi:MAG: helix-turn-helix domain-containing protein [Candidatus Nitrospinota bacterium M3_3B_026]